MCDDCQWEDLLEEIEALQDDKRYEFASNTLNGIYDWVEDRQHCTEGQQQAVRNIMGSVE